MSWLRLDDSFLDHPKIIGLTDRRLRVHLAAMLYSARFRTNGELPQPVLKTIGATPQDVTYFTTHELWDRDDHGTLTVHDFAAYNPKDPTGADRAKRYRQRDANRDATRDEHRDDGVTVTGPRARAAARVPSRPPLNQEQQQHYVARANPHPAADVDRAAAALTELGLTIARWPDVDPALVLAWVELAGTEAKTNPAGFVRAGLESGSWPSPRSSPAENGSRPRRAIAEVVRDIIRNVGAELDEHAFVAEVRQLEQRRGETIPAELAGVLLEEHRKVSQSQFPADPGPDAA